MPYSGTIGGMPTKGSIFGTNLRRLLGAATENGITRGFHETADTVFLDFSCAIRHSKTDSEGEWAVAYLGPAILERIRAWTAAAGIDSGPLFRRIAKGGRRVLGRLPPDPSARSFSRTKMRNGGETGKPQ